MVRSGLINMIREEALKGKRPSPIQDILSLGQRTKNAVRIQQVRKGEG